MTEQELDRMMRRVLLDSLKAGEEQEEDGQTLLFRNLPGINARCAPCWQIQSDGCTGGNVRYGGRLCGGLRSFC